MCNSAVYIDASPQRRDKFRRLQFEEIALYPAPYLFIVEGGEVDPCHNPTELETRSSWKGESPDWLVRPSRTSICIICMTWVPKESPIMILSLLYCNAPFREGAGGDWTESPI
jgi:hypothetical protein